MEKIDRIKDGSGHYCEECGRELCAICGACVCGEPPVICVHFENLPKGYTGQPSLDNADDVEKGEVLRTVKVTIITKTLLSNDEFRNLVMMGRLAGLNYSTLKVEG